MNLTIDKDAANDLIERELLGHANNHDASITGGGALFEETTKESQAYMSLLSRLESQRLPFINDDNIVEFQPWLQEDQQPALQLLPPPVQQHASSLAT